MATENQHNGGGGHGILGLGFLFLAIVAGVGLYCHYSDTQKAPEDKMPEPEKKPELPKPISQQEADQLAQQIFEAKKAGEGKKELVNKPLNDLQKQLRDGGYTYSEEANEQGQMHGVATKGVIQAQTIGEGKPIESKPAEVKSDNKPDAIKPLVSSAPVQEVGKKGTGKIGMKGNTGKIAGLKNQGKKLGFAGIEF